MRRRAALQLGVMVEVPSLLFELDEIAREADFLSIGTNDLMQFLFAADRENKRVADRFDPLGVSALRALRAIVEAADEAGLPGHGLRRDGRQAARDDGADRAGLPRLLDVGGLDRPGQGDAARARRRQAAQPARLRCWPRPTRSRACALNWPRWRPS